VASVFASCIHRQRWLDRAACGGQHSRRRGGALPGSFHQLDASKMAACAGTRRETVVGRCRGAGRLNLRSRRSAPATMRMPVSRQHGSQRNSHYELGGQSVIGGQSFALRSEWSSSERKSCHDRPLTESQRRGAGGGAHRDCGRKPGPSL